MKSRLFFVLTFSVMAVMPTLLMAQTLAYVDARRLIDEAPQGQEEIENLKNKFQARSQEIRGRIEEYEVRETEFKKNSLLMSPEELEEKSLVLQYLQRSIQRDQQIYNEDYARDKNLGLARMEKMISKVIIQIAKEKQIDLVVQQAVYASSKINLTDAVLEELNRSAQQ